jgi:hypothetical protein
MKNEKNHIYNVSGENPDSKNMMMVLKMHTWWLCHCCYGLLTSSVKKLSCLEVAGIEPKQNLKIIGKLPPAACYFTGCSKASSCLYCPPMSLLCINFENMFFHVSTPDNQYINVRTSQLQELFWAKNGPSPCQNWQHKGFLAQIEAIFTQSGYLSC